MKVFLEVPYGLSRAMSRVANALTLYAPNDVETVMRVKDADVVVLHTIGYETADLAAKLRATGQRYIVIQYCLKTTQRAATADWRETWAGAELVWSYYDLDAAVRAEGGEVDFNFYQSPLGVDSWVFSPGAGAGARGYAILTSGYVAASECINEVTEAVRRVFGTQFHLGPNLHLGLSVRQELGLSDERLAGVYRSCRYVSGLRRVEGFELPAAEGLVCGARPILFDRPHYRQWFDRWAEFIPEGSCEDVTDAVEAVLRRDYVQVTHEESVSAAQRFDWAKIVPAFWQQVGAGEGVTA